MSATQISARALLERLVGFDTTSHKSNLALVEFVRAYLADHGVESTVLGDKTGEKAALYATIGPNIEGGVVLSAHSDVVPTEGQPWTSDPYRLRQEGGRLYGRGSTDMKGFVATVLAAVPGFVAAGLKRPIHIALSYDEEVGCLGVRPLARHMKTRIAMPQAVIVGEPTSLKPVNAHKSAYRLESDVIGRSAHSSVPSWGVNAVYYAARLVAEIERLAERLAAMEVTDPRFKPPHPTASVGEITGGTAHNIVPDHCRVVWGIRGMPETDVPALVDETQAFADTQLASEMRKLDAACAIQTKIAASILPLKPRVRSNAETLIAELTGSAEMGAVSYGTDAGIFDDIGWPCVVCGPGDIAQAHKPDEFIAAEALEECAAMLARLGESLSAA